MQLGGVLGELPVEKAFDIARSYHLDRKKQAEKTMTPAEQQKMAGLQTHVIHGNWSDPKNAHRRLQHSKTALGKEWQGLDKYDRGQAMASYIIMVDQIHKGFTGHLKIKAKRFKEKEAKRKTAEAAEKVREALPQGGADAASIRDALPSLMHVHLVPQAMGGPLVPAKRTRNMRDLREETRNAEEIDEDYLRERFSRESHDFKTEPNTTEQVPIAKPEEDSGDQQNDGEPSKEAGDAQTFGDNEQPNFPEEEEFDMNQPSGSGAHSEKGDESPNEDNSDSHEEHPIIYMEGESQTCDRCFSKAGRRLARAKARALAAQKAKERPEMVSVCTQTYESVYPQWIFQLRRHFFYNACPDVKCLLDLILSSDIDERYAEAKECFMKQLQSGNIRTTHDFTVSLMVMIGIVEKWTIPRMRETFGVYYPLTTENLKTYVRELHYRDHYMVKIEFVIGVFQTCKKFGSKLPGPLSKAMNDYLGLRDARYSDDETEEVDLINLVPTEAEKIARAARNARKKASKKKAKKRNANVELCLERMNYDIKKLRELYAKEAVARGEIPPESGEDLLKNHRSKHSPEDCDDSIEYFGNKVWEMYKAMTPDYLTTEDILKWCEEKIANKANL